MHIYECAEEKLVFIDIFILTKRNQNHEGCFRRLWITLNTIFRHFTLGFKFCAGENVQKEENEIDKHYSHSQLKKSSLTVLPKAAERQVADMCEFLLLIVAIHKQLGSVKM